MAVWAIFLPLSMVCCWLVWFAKFYWFELASAQKKATSALRSGVRYEKSDSQKI